MAQWNRALVPALFSVVCAWPLGALAVQAEASTSTQQAEGVQQAADERVTELDRVKVEAYLLTLKDARRALEQVPGAVTLVAAEEFVHGPTSNLEDIVDFVPGVYAQTRSGPESRLSIRGSGISIPFALKGVRVLRNGLPIMEADGWYHSQLIEPFIVRYAEVYRGANALQYGASTLGGAINLVTHTGYTAPSFALRLEAGSDGHLHPQIAAGGVLKHRWDYFVSVSNQHADGFREHSKGDHSILYANIGYRHGANAETRLHINAADSRQELIGALTREELEQDISQGDAGEFISYVDAQSVNEFERYRLDLQHSRRFGTDGRLDFSLFHEIQDVYHPLPFVLIEKNDLTTNGASLRVTSSGTLLGSEHHFTWGGLWMEGSSDDMEFAPLGGIFGQAVVEPFPPGEPRSLDSGASTAELFAEDRVALAEEVDLVLGAQLAYARRELAIDVFGESVGDQRLEDSYRGFSPKLGLLWQAAEQVQVFGNLSRSFEPPVMYDFRNANGILDAHTATTLELGTRGSSGNWQWELALYHARVQDEILSAEEPPNSGQYVTANAEDTLHSGVEFGLDGHIPLNWLGGDTLNLRLAYTWNRFRFDDNSSFTDNELPGVPRRFGRIELGYEHPSGFYLGPNVEVASAYYVDYANTLEADGYAIIGLRGGYKSRGFDLFVQAVNLTDEVYAANTGVINNAGGEDQAVFIPGRPRSMFAGVEVSW